MERGIDFMTRQKSLGKPFFLYLPISHALPNLPSKRFEGQSRIGQFSDSLMEGDAIVGRMLDALKDTGLDDNTIVVFASDNALKAQWYASSAAACQTWDRRELIAENWVM